MRIRTVKPEFWASESNGRLSRDSRLLFVGLLNLADNEGRLRGHVGFIAGQVFPFDADAREVTTTGLEALERAGKVKRYSVDGDAYLTITKFCEHQKVDKRFPSKLPAPPIAAERMASHADFTPVHPEFTPLEVEQGTGKWNREVEVEAAQVAAVSPPPKEKVAIALTEPETPPQTWGGEDFWRWAQTKRVKAGFVVERPPKLLKLSGWYSATLLELNGDVGWLQEALYRFGNDKFWQAKDPPLPFAAFMSEWRKYAPRKEHAHAG